MDSSVILTMFMSTVKLIFDSDVKFRHIESARLVGHCLLNFYLCIFVYTIHVNTVKPRLFKINACCGYHHHSPISTG